MQLGIVVAMSQIVLFIAPPVRENCRAINIFLKEHFKNDMDEPVCLDIVLVVNNLIYFVVVYIAISYVLTYKVDEINHAVKMVLKEHNQEIDTIKSEKLNNSKDSYNL